MEEHFSQIVALIGERARAKMLWNLLDGRAYTATELATCADISKQACSNHLQKLIDAKILVVEKQGRYRYYRFASDQIALVIENLASIVPPDIELKKTTKEVLPEGIRFARTCYDHLAGRLGVQITNCLLEKGVIVRHADQYEVSEIGNHWFYNQGINIADLKKSKRKFAYPCLDWSERKHHIGGALGCALLRNFLEKDWVRRKSDCRSVILTGKGKKEMYTVFKLSF